MNLSHRKATEKDLPAIISLLARDIIGETREKPGPEIDPRYLKAFRNIDIDKNQYLMVVESDDEIIGVCHLSIMYSLTIIGNTRMQLEGIRIKPEYRGNKIGTWMMQQAIEYAKQHDVKMVQLSSDLKREKAIEFYKQNGFVYSHAGMKLLLD